MGSIDFLAGLIKAFARALQPLDDSLASVDKFAALLAEFGWTLAPTADMAVIRNALGVKADLTALAAEADTLEKTLAEPTAMGIGAISEQVTTLVHDIQAVMRDVRMLTTLTSFASLPAPLNQAEFWKTFPEEVLDFLIFTYLQQYTPTVFGILRFLGILSEENVSPTTPGRLPYLSRSIDWARVPATISDPGSLMPQVYVWGTKFDYARFLSSLEAVFQAFHVGIGLYWPDRGLLDLYYDPHAASRPTIQYLSCSPLALFDSSSSALLLVKLSFIALPIPPAKDNTADPDGIALFPLLTGQAATKFKLSDQVDIELSGGFEAQVIAADIHPKPTGTLITGPKIPITALAKLNAKAPDGKPWILIGSADSSHIELAVAHTSLSAYGDPTDPTKFEFKIEMGADTATLVVDFSEGDGFLQKILGAQTHRVDLATAISWSSKTGFGFNSNAQLQATIPVHASLAGVVNVNTVYIGLIPGDKPNSAALEVSASGSLVLGPLMAVVDRVGLSTQLTAMDTTKPDALGNLGDLDVSFGFKPPDGVGLAIDAEGVTGGGYLAFDKDQYSGVLELLMEQVRIKAVGLLETQMPGGAPGYSLAALLSAEFLPPINLPLGFTLNAVGGLLAVNRTMSLDGLKARYKAHTIDSLLFPPDQVGNAPQVIHDLQTLFPPQDGRYIIGPAVEIGWGTPSLATARLGIFVELFDPVRIALLGALSAVLPDQDHPSIVLQLDILGIIDLQKKTAAIDASLHDSKIESFPVLGDMALRLGWGTPRTFVLVIGDVNPGYASQLPPDFPKLQRATVIIAQGNDPRLTLSAYLAITSNSVQFGADLELSASAGGFSVHGYLTFDALFIFSPFSFDTEVKAGVEVRGYGLSVGVKLDLHLSGPRPCLVDGTATVSAWLISYSVHVHATIGSGTPIPLPAVDPTQPLLQALSDPGSWSVALPDGVVRAVSIAKPPPPSAAASPTPSTATDGAATVLLDPMGLLAVTERVLPLGMTLQWFGNAAPANVNRFDVQGVTLTDLADSHNMASAAPIEPAQDYFARAQFLTLTDAQKLSEPAFDQFDAGVKVGAAAFQPGQQTTVPVTYETLLVDDLRLPARPGTDDYHPSAAAQVAQSRHSAASQSLARTSGARRFTVPGVKSSVALSPVTYVVASTQDLSIHPAMQDLDVAGGVTYTQAAERLQAYLASHPSEAGWLQVLPRYECKEVAA